MYEWFITDEYNEVQQTRQSYLIVKKRCGGEVCLKCTQKYFHDRGVDQKVSRCEIIGTPPFSVQNPVDTQDPPSYTSIMKKEGRIN